MSHRRTDSSGTTQMIWDGDDLLAQVDLLGNLVQYWTWAPELPEGRWSRLVKSRYPSTNAHPDQYLHSDWLGTVVALSLPDGTALLHSGTHPRPWGEEDSAAVGPLSWVGNQGYWRENQLARSMHYVRARWYMDANSQGWLSPDPLGFEAGDWNLYRYVGNRPTVKVDPSGLAYVGSEPTAGGELSGSLIFADPWAGIEDECSPHRRHRTRHPRVLTNPIATIPT